MPRPPKCRRVEFEPRFTYFKPAGVPKCRLSELVLSVEEVEAIRLKDLEGLEQETCAERMHISRPTFQRILSTARNKLAEAIIRGKAIKISGGNYQLVDRYFQCPTCHNIFPRRFGQGRKVTGSCPVCGNPVEEKTKEKNDLK